MIDRKYGFGLRYEWDITKEVLLGDLDTSNYNVIEKVLIAFMGIGNMEIIPILVEKLNNNGNSMLAEVYLNCGHDELYTASRDWADRRGYQINIGDGAHPVSWGGW